MTDHRFIYLAHPIDQAPAIDSPISSIELASSYLARKGVGTYDPAKPWFVGTGVKVGPEIERVNHHAMSVCTGAVAWLPKGVPTVGVPKEIERMSNGWAMPVAIITNNEESWSLAGWNDLVKVFLEGQEREAVHWLLEQPAGTTPFNSPAPGKMLMRVDTDRGAPTLMPTRSYDDDAGLDLWVAEDTEIPPGEFVDIPAGIRIQLPTGTWGLLTGRSSTLRKRGLLVNQGVIDVGYRGSLYAGVWNLTDRVVEVAKGDRIAQLIVLHNATERVHAINTPHFEEHPRGTNGFGSSGA